MGMDGWMDYDRIDIYIYKYIIYINILYIYKYIIYIYLFIYLFTEMYSLMYV